jgi:hypothetical protein
LIIFGLAAADAGDYYLYQIYLKILGVAGLFSADLKPLCLSLCLPLYPPLLPLPACYLPVYIDTILKPLGHSLYPSVNKVLADFILSL